MLAGRSQPCKVLPVQVQVRHDMDPSDLKRVKELEAENAKLKRM